jgi:transposase
MSNVLKVSLQTTIYSLAERGWSQRRIASELGINRETVSRYLRLVKASDSAAGVEDRADRKPAISITGKAVGAGPKPAISTTGFGAGRRSRCEALVEVILAKLEEGLSARRIHQDLVEQNGFSDSYQSVQRFVRKLKLSYEQVSSWPFADAILRLMEYDNITSTIKARRAGFHDCIDMEEMFKSFFANLRKDRVIP